MIWGNLPCLVGFSWNLGEYGGLVSFPLGWVGNFPFGYFRKVRWLGGLLNFGWRDSWMVQNRILQQLAIC